MEEYPLLWRIRAIKKGVPLDRLELSHLAPEANALSSELQGHKDFYFTMI
jgi:hypothetical protein